MKWGKMIRIEHIAQTLERWDNWTGYDEAKIRRLLGVDDKKAGVSQRAANALIDGLYPGHTSDISRPGKGVFGQGEAALMTSGQN